jgi:hypothetical protein
VYVEETSTKGERDQPFYHSHVGAMLASRNGLPIVGTWYGITPIRSHIYTTSEGPYLLGARLGTPDFNADYFYKTFRLLQVDTVIASTVELADILGADPRYRRLAGHGGFSAWQIGEPLLPALGMPPGAGTLTDIVATRGRVRGRVDLHVPEVWVRTRETWHPWWRATVDGAPAEVAQDPDSGMASIRVTHSGLLELTWADRDHAGKGISLGALGVLLGLWAWGRRRATVDPA